MFATTKRERARSLTLAAPSTDGRGEAAFKRIGISDAARIPYDLET
jgi:hypothetical protein